MVIKSMPGYQQAMQYIQQNGGDAKSAFYNLVEEAKKAGVQNPESALDQARNAMNNR